MGLKALFQNYVEDYDWDKEMIQLTRL